MSRSDLAVVVIVAIVVVALALVLAAVAGLALAPAPDRVPAIGALAKLTGAGAKLAAALEGLLRAVVDVLRRRGQ